ncbi:MAG: aldo/keto reductase [Clostridia bacterium]|nr:aldo/keto reductase [Clostridia bacterium]
MIYSTFQDKKLSLLGFGAMRLPTLPDGGVDAERTADMVRLAFGGGVNYIDTAYPYHGGASESVLGDILQNYPRESYYLATKFPGHQIAESYDPAAVFEEQLKKCRVDYFDFYLLHNVYEKSAEVYNDPKWGIVDYFIEQKKKGRIKHLGFSTHARYDSLRAFLDRWGAHMEFCQMQLNYLDWSLQDAEARYNLLTERGIPVWVMEPLRGGKLASVNGLDNAVEQAFRWLQGLDNVKMVLSGMSSEEQMEQNIAIFDERKPLSEDEVQKLYALADGMKNSLPCTACRYCCDGCPMELDIPRIIGAYNDHRFSPGFLVTMNMESLPEGHRPADCIGCGACAAVCPQNIDIPKAMQDFAAELSKMPSWAQVCRERDEAQKKAKQGK